MRSRGSAGDLRVKTNKGAIGEYKFCNRDFKFVLSFIMELHFHKHTLLWLDSFM